MTVLPQRAIPAVYMRGGTSRAIVFHASDLLPGGAREWDPLFAAALGSPDPGGRQLDGLGCGISSLSKVAIVAKSHRQDADVDFTFAQVSIATAGVSYRGNCGNISAAIGPFSVDEGLVSCPGDHAMVRIFNTNTSKMIHADFPLQSGRAAVAGNQAIAGVAGTGAPVRLTFLDPGGATTGKLLPTGNRVDHLEIEGLGRLAVSMVDATNPVVFVAASSFGLAGDETPMALAGDTMLMTRLGSLRVAASLAMGLASGAEEASTLTPNLPLVALLSRAEGRIADIRVRMISAGQPHKATPLTGAMCLAVAARLGGTVADDHCLAITAGGGIRIAHASGVVVVDAEVIDERANKAIVFRSTRRLMEGRILVPC